MRFASASHWSSVSALLEVLANCSDSARAYRSIPGIDARSSAAVSRLPVRFEIVPPVAMSLTLGSDDAGRALCRASSTSAGANMKAW